MMRSYMSSIINARRSSVSVGAADDTDRTWCPPRQHTISCDRTRAPQPRLPCEIIWPESIDEDEVEEDRSPKRRRLNSDSPSTIDRPQTPSTETTSSNATTAEDPAEAGLRAMRRYTEYIRHNGIVTANRAPPPATQHLAPTRTTPVVVTHTRMQTHLGNRGQLSALRNGPVVVNVPLEDEDDDDDDEEEDDEGYDSAVDSDYDDYDEEEDEDEGYDSAVDSEYDADSESSERQSVAGSQEVSQRLRRML